MSHCVICGKDGGVFTGIHQLKDDQILLERSVPAHEDCISRWEAHHSGDREFTQEELAQIDEKMNQYTWKSRKEPR